MVSLVNNKASVLDIILFSFVQPCYPFPSLLIDFNVFFQVKIVLFASETVSNRNEDHVTGENYEYRKPWVVEKLKGLSEVFVIEVCAYAIMSNHYHVMLHGDADRAENWDQNEVIKRWSNLLGGNVLR